jgi:hypothetical protein
MVALSMSFSFLKASFSEQLLDGGGKVEWCASSASTMSGLGGVAKTRLDGLAQAEGIVWHRGGVGGWSA